MALSLEVNLVIALVLAPVETYNAAVVQVVTYARVWVGHHLSPQLPGVTVVGYMVYDEQCVAVGRGA